MDKDSGQERSKKLRAPLCSYATESTESNPIYCGTSNIALRLEYL